MPNAVYDPEDLKQKERQRPMDDEGAEPLSDQEQEALQGIEAGFGDTAEDPQSDKKKPGKGEDAKTDAPEESEGGGDIPFRKEKKRRLRFRVNRKQAAGAGVAGLGIGGVFAIFSVVSGPAQLIHLSQLLQDFHFGNNETLTDNSTGDLIRYARGQGYRNNLGYVGNKLADHYEVKLKAAGLTPEYNGTTSIQSFLIDPNTPEGARGMKNMNARGVDTDAFERLPDGKVRANLRGFGSSSEARKILRGSVDTIDLSGKSSAVAKRLLIIRGGVTMRPFRNLVRESGEETIDYRKRVRTQNEDIIKNGETDVDLRQRGEDATDDPDGNQDAAEAEADRVAGEVNDLVDTDNLEPGEAGVKQLSGKLKTAALGGVGAATFASFICVVNEFGDSFGPYLHQNVVLPMMRLGMFVVSAGSQLQGAAIANSTGQVTVNLEEVGVLTDSLYDSIEGTSAFGAASIQANLGNEGGGTPLPSSMNPGKEKPEFFQKLDSVPGMDTVCDALLSTVGQIGLSIAGAITGGGPAALIADFITDFAVGAALDAFNVFDNLARIVFGGGVNLDAQGGLFGAMADVGTKVAANDAAIAMGGRELLPEEYAQLNSIQQELDRQEDSQKSFYARTLDVGNSRSLVGKALIQNPSFANLSAGMMSLSTLPSKVFSIFGNGFASLTPLASAQSGARYDYGFPDFGFSVAEQDNPIIQNPYENAEYVYDNQGDFAQYTGCFGTTVDINTGVLSPGQTVSYSELDPACNDPNDENLLRYRAFLLHTIVAKTLLCYEGIDEAACAELGFNGGGTRVPSTIAAPGLNGFTIPCTGQPREVVRKTPAYPSADWTNVPDSGTIGLNSLANPIKVYIRDACTTVNLKTVVIVSSIHGSENGGQLVSHELLFNAKLPSNVRIVAIPELNGFGIPTGTRKNASGVDLNRNNDYLWDTLLASEETSPSGKNYKGTAPGSEPETAAINSFLTSLGTASLSLNFHDNLDYIAPVGSTSIDIARIYATAMGMDLGYSLGTTVTQRGSLDAWYNSTTGTPTILVEMSSTQTQAMIDRHTDAIVQVLESGLL